MHLLPFYVDGVASSGTCVSAGQVRRCMHGGIMKVVLASSMPSGMAGAALSIAGNRAWRCGVSVGFRALPRKIPHSLRRCRPFAQSTRQDRGISVGTVAAV
jgi:hypothetical protein